MGSPKKSSVITFTVPPDLKQILEAAQQIGYYDSLSEFLRDSIRFTLEEKQHIRVAITHQLYQQKKIGLGKAAELLQLSLKETKERMEEW